MRGAPQVGFSATMRKISSRTSRLKGFLPAARRVRDSQDQYNRKPVRCQRTTVSGVTSRSGFFHPDQSFRRATQNTLSKEPSRRRGRLARRASSCSRSARFSSMRSLRDRNAPTSQPTKCRSSGIMARILADGQCLTSPQVPHSMERQNFGERQVGFCLILSNFVVPEVCGEPSTAGGAATASTPSTAQTQKTITKCQSERVHGDKGIGKGAFLLPEAFQGHRPPVRLAGVPPHRRKDGRYCYQNDCNAGCSNLIRWSICAALNALGTMRN